MTPTIEVSNSPEQKKPEEVPIKQDPVQRSLAKPDACAKPCTIGKTAANKGVRIRVTNQRPPGRPKKKKRDPRDVKFW